MMKFKNIFGILAISAVSMMTASCSEDTMDRINKDEAHPGASVVSAKFQLTDAIVSSVFTTNNGNFAWYVASYTEQILGTGNNQLKNAELRSINEIAASSTFDNEWNGTYLNLNNIQQMIAKCEEGGLAHALKARYLLHEAGRAADKNAQYAQILEEANAAVADGFNGANLNIFDGVNQIDAWSAYWASRAYSASSKTVDDLMVARQDPREPIYNYNGIAAYDAPSELGLMTPGDKTAACATQATNFPLWLWNGNDEVKIPSHLMSKSELYFIIAEVKARLGQDAKADFETAVKASLADYATVGATEISNEDVAAYLAGETATKFAANPLNEILVQKYIAQTRDEQLETFNDMRRCNYLDGSYPVAMTNPNNTQAGQNRLPLRLPYGSSDVLSNPNVKEAFGSGNDAGKYIFTENVWWAGGNR